jgi:hypothetical protein
LVHTRGYDATTAGDDRMRDQSQRAASIDGNRRSVPKPPGW